MTMDVVIISLVLASSIASTVTPMSLEKILLTSVTKPEVLDFFHVMPDGEIKVLQGLDMMLSLDQYKQLYMEDKHGHDRHKRKAAIDAEKWTNRMVFYEIPKSANITQSDRSNIKEAIGEYEKYTCLNFVESTEAVARIQFKHGAMCSSEVGMRGKIQELTLTNECLESKGVIVHEIGHSIGWYHEHMRPDRNNYIIVDNSRIDDFFKKDYEVYKNKIETYDIPYDYTSVMHYGNDYFNGSIKARNPKYQDKLGQRNGLSFKDIKLANVMYKCDEGCGTGLDCGDGFQINQRFNNRSACECWCDSGNIYEPLIPCQGRQVIESTTPVTYAPSTAKSDEECVDKLSAKKCDQYKKYGFCTTRQTVMLSMCSKTCGLCGMHHLADIHPLSCLDHEPGCAVMGMAGFFNDPGMRDRMSKSCKVSSGLCTPPDPCEIQNMMSPKGNYGTVTAVKRDIVPMIMFSSTTIVISMIEVGLLLPW